MLLLPPPIQRDCHTLRHASLVHVVCRVVRVRVDRGEDLPPIHNSRFFRDGSTLQLALAGIAFLGLVGALASGLTFHMENR